MAEKGAYTGPLPVMNDDVTEIRIKSTSETQPGVFVLRLTDSLCELAEQKVKAKYGKPSWELPTEEGAKAWSETLMELMMERVTFEPEVAHG